MRYKDAMTPREFLEHVISTWDEFCRVNTGLAQAIEGILDENQRLNEQVKQLRTEQKKTADRNGRQ